MATPRSPFLWGTATAAFQIEGATDCDGRGPSIWDEFCTPDRIYDGTKPTVACDSYHRIDQDIAAMKELGTNAYRFSISWPRIFPQGTGAVNPAGVAYYHELIDKLVANGITPMATLYHWDLPAALQHRYGGWLSRQIIADFTAYAEFCFKEYADKVHHWCTINEAWCTAVLGHAQGCFAPGGCVNDDAYIAGHNQILAHAYAAQAFHQGGYQGQIGMAINCDWREPLTDAPEDVAAAQKGLEFFYGWFGDPVAFGRYPQSMRDALGDRLPVFTPEEVEILRQSADFMGLNHYTSLYASARPAVGMGDIGPNGNGGLSADQGIYLSAGTDWEFNDMQWGIVPWGFRKMLNWVGNRYNRPIYVTENGCACPEPTLEIAQHDEQRCRFIKGYLEALHQAVLEDHCPVAGYFHWSLMDNFEWTRGFSRYLGLFRCTPENPERIAKQSVGIYRDIIKNSPL